MQCRGSKSSSFDTECISKYMGDTIIADCRRGSPSQNSTAARPMRTATTVAARRATRCSALSAGRRSPALRTPPSRTRSVLIAHLKSLTPYNTSNQFAEVCAWFRTIPHAILQDFPLTRNAQSSRNWWLCTFHMEGCLLRCSRL